MSLIIPLLLLFSGCIAAAVFFKKAAEEIVPISIMSIVLILYVFYCFDKLIWGYYAIIALGVLCYLSVFYLIKKIGLKQSLIQLKTNLITPAMIIFFLLCAFFFLTTRYNVVSLWDELRLWGAYPKILFYTDKLQLGNNALLYSSMQAYPPGMPLFVYFFEKCGSAFSEPHIFFVYAIFGSSFFLPVLRRIKWRDSWVIIPLTLIIFLIPSLFYNSYNDWGDYYKSLFIDPILGIVLAYDIYLLTTDSFKTWFGTYRLGLALSTTILIKDSGSMFAIVAFLGAIFLEFFIYGKNQTINKSSVSMKIKRICFSGFLTLGVYFCWQFVLSKFSVKNTFKFDIFSLQFAFVKKFIKALLTQKIITSDFIINKTFLTFAFLFIFILLVNIFIITLYPKEKQKLIVLSSCFLYVINVIFIIGLFLLCASNFQGNLYSFSRYICTILLSDISFAFLLFVNVLKSNFQKIFLKGYNKLIISLFIVLSIIIFPIRQPVVYNGNWNKSAQYHANIITTYLDNDLSRNSDTTINVFLLTNKDVGSYAGLHHRIYFDLIEKNIFIKNFYTYTNITIDKEATKELIQNTANKFKTTLLEGNYNYVYIAVKNPLIGEQFSQLFGEDVEVSSMYKVKVVKDDIVLEKMKMKG